MATATMATAAGAAALLYYTLNRKLQSSTSSGEDDDEGTSLPNHPRLGIDRVSNRLIQAPATWLETISTLSETLRFTYSETLGKWPIGDLAFGISFLLKRQGHLHVGNVFGGKDSQRLKGPEIVAELRYLLNLLTLCWHFSKKPFPLFLEETGYSEENVLLQEPKAGILKPAFTILVDHNTECFLLLIRGTHSIKDTLTAATGAVVPFHHSVVHEGGVTDLVLGYAHCGMVAAARWIAKLATPCILKALAQNPGYKLKIVGHSLGGGTAALLTYILREQKELSTATCVTFAPAACMTWDLAESGGDFITSVINGADLVPTFSAASVDDLRAEVVMKRAQSMAQAAWRRPALRLSSWSCMGPRQRTTTVLSNSKEESSLGSAAKTETSELLLASLNRSTNTTTIETVELAEPSSRGIEWTSEIECSCSDEIVPDDQDGDISDGEDLMGHNRHEDRMTEVELWQQLEQELYDRTEGEDVDVAKEIREEEAAAMAEVSNGQRENSAPEMNEIHRFFPPGKIMHIVFLPPESDDEKCETDASPTSNGSNNGLPEETRIGIFLTPRSLYSKLRLSQTMISDHFMPVYRRQIEKLIKELEKEESLVGDVL
ncbi:Mono-/di-acylglycerol lipase [Parasponia andersonii]|uniref:Mono-/di-acylglycerol lipase n=1 Tax=Parasponia andersonii TaxID=3476 RepID=A0A2P5ACI9_PARAD|nr:Mono-/di-acylglycerol lipase [Parasponia andersonii]